MPDARLEFSPLERRVLEWLAMPADPETPEGSAGSLSVFRAGDNYYTWLVLMWAALSVLVAIGLLGASLAVVQASERWPPWGDIAATTLLVIAWVTYASGAVLTFLARRLNFRLRWYIVTDRSLRIRSGVFAIRELTMTYRNVQEIRVTAGPLEHAMGLATVEVRNAVRDRYDFAAALLARCGGAARFFGNSEALFATQTVWLGKAGDFETANSERLGKLPMNDSLKAIARGVGLDAIMKARGFTPVQIDACLSDAAAQKLVVAMTNEAWSVRKISGTPSFLINGKTVEGPGSWANVENGLKAALAVTVK